MTNEELAKKANWGDNKALSLLYEQVSGIINKSAKIFYKLNSERCISAGVELCDLMNEGYFAMLEAVSAFCKNSSGYKFNTFLNYPLRNHFNAMIGYRTQKGLNEPLNNYIRLDTPVPGNDEDITVADTIADDKAEFADDILMRITYAGVFGAVKEALKDTPQYFEVIYLKYALGISQNEIAAKLGCTAPNVHEMLYKAMRILRKPNKVIGAYRDEIIGASYARGGLSRFNDTWESSVEWAARKLLEKENKEQP